MFDMSAMDSIDEELEDVLLAAIQAVLQCAF